MDPPGTYDCDGSGDDNLHPRPSAPRLALLVEDGCLSEPPMSPTSPPPYVVDRRTISNDDDDDDDAARPPPYNPNKGGGGRGGGGGRRGEAGRGIVVEEAEEGRDRRQCPADVGQGRMPVPIPVPPPPPVVAVLCNIQICEAVPTTTSAPTLTAQPQEIDDDSTSTSDVEGGDRAPTPTAEPDDEDDNEKDKKIGSCGCCEWCFALIGLMMILAVTTLLIAFLTWLVRVIIKSQRDDPGPIWIPAVGSGLVVIVGCCVRCCWWCSRP
jgi:hypothetical protein